MKRLPWVVFIALACVVVAAAQGSVRAVAHVSAHSSAYGRVLFGASGKALYVFEADKGSTSRCYGACARAWPPLLTTGAPVGGTGVDRMLLGTTKRRGGSMQVTYHGHPLYTYSADKPGRIGCQHVNMHGGLWLVIKTDGRVSMAKGHMHMA